MIDQKLMIYRCIGGSPSTFKLYTMFFLYLRDKVITFLAL